MFRRRRTRQPAPKQYRSDVQDSPRFWNQAYVLLNDTTRATVEQARSDPKHGFHDSDTGNPETTKQLHEFCLRHSITEGALIMELGCGGGRICMIWDAMSREYDMQLSIVGIDHAKGAAEVAQARMPNLEFRCCSASSIPFDDRRFDLIFTHTALQHNSAWKQGPIFCAVHRALKHKAIFYMMNELTFSSREQPEIELSPFYSDDRGSAGTAAWWIKQIAQHGFELVEYQGSSYVWRRMA